MPIIDTVATIRLIDGTTLVISDVVDDVDPDEAFPALATRRTVASGILAALTGGDWIRLTVDDGTDRVIRTSDVRDVTVRADA